MSAPRLLLHLEGVGVLAVACFFYQRLNYSWPRFAVFLLAPDVCLLAFLVNRKFGVVCYNAVHTYVAPFVLFGVLAVVGPAHAFWIPLLWIAHIGMDRLCGYGLKYEADLKQTHLHRA